MYEDFSVVQEKEMNESVEQNVLLVCPIMLDNDELKDRNDEDLLFDEENLVKT